ncbi:tyrosine-protein phosphatase [Breznakia pachnodae]|uniref:Protein-tyrosine phosphatase n=1 Tax=Breznakia pachnodae TaxID=265178 RepID=A0ABU0E6N6_9FIRM|nr:tyrosine-protein phosphatase [Breznakia pachnodae]MDQ0362376.1 protein-tyrosine phosphatase [Breznakia pachnodae]
MKPMIRLPLDKAYNVRELGGYVTKDNKLTKWQSFLRADDLSELTKADEQLMKDYGVTSILDLRGENETKRSPDTLASDLDITHVNIPFMIDSIGDVSKVNPDDFDFTLGDFYIGLLQCKGQVRKIFEVIADMPEGAVVFHCAAGKDRTGVVAMLLLGLVGVSRQDIVTNYEQTFTNLRYRRGIDILEESNDQYMKFMYSKAEYIEKTISYLEKEYGTYEEYLCSCDISDEVLKIVKERLVEDM